jgi:hypothetical protein
MAVQDSERLSRFLLFSRWYNTTRVKVDAFICQPHTELSVSCTEGLEENHVWELGRQTAVTRNDRPRLHGRADIRALHVRRQSLEVIRDDTPAFHANIVGWLGNTKESQRLQALELAADAGAPVLVPIEN